VRLSEFTQSGFHTKERTMSRVAAIALAVVLCVTPAFAQKVRPRTLLNQRLPELKFTGVSLSDAVDFLRDVSSANIHVNWRALEEQGIGKDTQVNLRARGVTLQKALDLVLSEAGAGDKLAYDIDQGVIEITTREIADRKMYTKVYPIDDLL